MELLACPRCNAHLNLTTAGEDGQGNIESGSLKCATCSRSYPVTRGIPRFNTNEDQVAAHFTNEFEQLETDDRDMDAPELLSFFFYTRSGIDLSIGQGSDPYLTVMPDAGAYRAEHPYFEGKVCLDAGCGPGRFIKVVAEQGAGYVVGLDLGDHVDRAARRCKDLDNVDFVQGSVLEPPFRKGTFEYVYSIGVLHHTPDPAQGGRKLVDLIAPDGGMSVWVYPESYWGGGLRAPVSKAMHRGISRLSPGTAFWVCRRILFPIGRVQRSLARRRWSKLLAAPLFLLNIPRHPRDEVMLTTIYDYFAPPFISTHSYEEVGRWFGGAFASMTKVGVPVGWFGAGKR